MMFQIRAQQMATLNTAASQNFEDRMVVHLGKIFPHLCSLKTQEELRELIAYGVERAAAHRLVREYHVCLYLHLLMIFGRDFDSATDAAWLQESLLAPESNASARIEAAYELAIEHTNQRGRRLSGFTGDSSDG